MSPPPWDCFVPKVLAMTGICHSCAGRNPQRGGEYGCLRKRNMVFNIKNQENTYYYEKCEIASPSVEGLAMDVG